MTQITILSSPTVDDVWKDHLLPWFRQAGAVAWKSSLPTAIVTPCRASAVQLMRRLSSEDGVALFNVRFWAPGDLWHHLAAVLNLGTVVGDAGDLRLVARAAAEQVSLANPGDLPAKTLAAAPDAVLEIVKTLEAGGWGACEVEGSSFRAVAEQMRTTLEGANADTLARRYFQIEAASEARKQPVFESLLFVGFDGSSFSQWPLLKAATIASNHAVVVIPETMDRGESHDFVWTGSWEELGGDLLVVGADTEPVLGSVVNAFDDVDAKSGSCAGVPVDFAVARDDSTQAQAIVRRVADLVAGGITPVAVVAPNSGPLAREISLALSAAQIAHYCSLSPVSTATEERAWGALIDLQADPDVERMATLVGLHDFPVKLCGLTSSALREAITRKADVLMLANLPPLGQMLLLSPRDTDQSAGKLLVEWPTFPERATVAAFETLLRKIGDTVGLPALGVRLRLAVARLELLSEMVVSKSAFCEWARSAVADPKHAPAADSNHPAAHVQVLRLHEAVQSRWAHVLFAGQNEGISPSPIRQGGALSDDVIDRLNAQVRILNRHSTKDGRAGDDDSQLVVRPGKSLCLSPLMRRSLEVRDFLRVLSTCDSATLCFSLRDPLRPGSPMQPGSYLARLYYLVEGQALTLAAAQESALAPILPTEIAFDPVAEQVRKAYFARRDVGSANGIYDYCLSAPPTWPVKVSASEWAKVVKAPAIQWLKSFVGVGVSRREAAIEWNLALGVWIHEWLQSASGRGFVANPGQEWEPRTISASERFRREVEKANGGALPSWWISVHGQALYKAGQLARSLATVKMPFITSERSIPTASIPLQGGATLPTGGRVDLIFSDRKLEDGNGFAGAELLVVDFKTGADRELDPKRMIKGDGAQLGLYGMRVKMAGAAKVGLCLLKPGGDVETQMTADDAAMLTPLWCDFAAMLRTGAFGQTEPVRDEFGRGASFPLATLSVAPGILAARHALTSTVSWRTNAPTTA